MFPSALAEKYGLRISTPRRKVPVWKSGALVSLLVDALHWSYTRIPIRQTSSQCTRKLSGFGDNICKLRV